jgi:hypothetical protein
MAQKKGKLVGKTDLRQVKRFPSSKRFYFFLLTTLLGMLLFVTYYASQQIQIYQSSASGGCSTLGKTCDVKEGMKCCAGLTCKIIAGGRGVCECTVGKTKCGNGNVQICKKQSNGHTAWVLKEKCKSGYVCSNGACKKTTTKPPTKTSPKPPTKCTNKCSPVGKKRCYQGNAQTCKKQSNGCTAWATTTCKNGCSNGACKTAAGCNKNGLTCTGSGAQCCSKYCDSKTKKCVNPPTCRKNNATCTGSGVRCCSGYCSSKGLCAPKPKVCPKGQHLPAGKTEVADCVPDCTTYSQSSCSAANGCFWDTSSNSCKSCSKQGVDCAVSCDQLTDETTCLAQECYWNSGTGICMDSVPACTEITDETNCIGTGCYWDSESGICMDSAPACSDLTDETSCLANANCAWNSDSNWCGDNCSLISDANTCSANEYCAWDDSSSSCVADGWTATPGTGTGGTGETASVTLNLVLSFQGITQAPTSGENSMDVLVTLAGGPEGQEIQSTGTFTVDSSARWTGQVSFDDVALGGDYRVLVKGPKHIQKKICDATPTEASAGTYHCGEGNITINSGDNTFNFSGIKLLVGDLAPQDGIVDSYDISLLRNSLCTTDNPDVCKDSTVLSEADLNLDGIIDTQDYSLLISSLSVKYDEK